VNSYRFRESTIFFDMVIEYSIGDYMLIILNVSPLYYKTQAIEKSYMEAENKLIPKIVITKITA